MNGNYCLSSGECANKPPACKVGLNFHSCTCTDEICPSNNYCTAGECSATAPAKPGKHKKTFTTIIIKKKKIDKNKMNFELKLKKFFFCLFYVLRTKYAILRLKIFERNCNQDNQKNE